MHFQYQIWHWIEQSTFHTLARCCWVFCTMPSFIMCWKYICITVSQMLVIWQLVLVFAWHNILTFGVHFSIAINLHPIVNKSMVVLNKNGISCTGQPPCALCCAWWEFAFLWPSFSSCKWHYCLSSSVCCAWLETDKFVPFHYIFWMLFMFWCCLRSISFSYCNRCQHLFLHCGSVSVNHTFEIHKS